MDERSTAITGISKLIILATKRHIAEAEFLSYPERFQTGIVLFSGIDDYFAPIINEHTFIKQALIEATRPSHRRAIRAEMNDDVCMHVRYGDYVDLDQGDFPNFNHVRQPLAWYIHALNECRRCLGKSTRAWVFSDASDAEVQPLLGITGVRRAFFGSSIADLLAMSTARVLIASGSTFSMWASYLGRMPTIWPLKQRRQRIHGCKWEYEIELGYEPLPPEVASLIRSHQNACREIFV